MICVCPTAALSFFVIKNRSTLAWFFVVAVVVVFLCLLNSGFQVAQDGITCCYFISLCSKEPLHYLPGTHSRTGACQEGPTCFVCHVCS